MDAAVEVKPRQRWMLGTVALVGLAISSLGVVAFVLTIVQNSLPWSPDQTIRQHYVAVGDSYSQGFLTGFFVCFFLSLFAIVIGSYVQSRRMEKFAASAR